MQSTPEKLLKKHPQLTHSEMMKVVSHVQRRVDDMFLNTLMLEGHEVPFKYKRTKKFQSLVGQRVNLTYYADTEVVAGLEFEIMRVVRVKRA